MAQKPSGRFFELTGHGIEISSGVLYLLRIATSKAVIFPKTGAGVKFPVKCLIKLPVLITYAVGAHSQTIPAGMCSHLLGH